MNDVYNRTFFTSNLIKEFIQTIDVVGFINEIPALSKIDIINEKIKLKLEVLKNFIHLSVVKSPRLQLPEHRGKEIIKTIFEALKKDNGYKLLPYNYRNLHDKIEEKYKTRMICDFIACMTDRYVLEFYGRLKSENPQTIFKPI